MDFYATPTKNGIIKYIYPALHRKITPVAKGIRDDKREGGEERRVYDLPREAIINKPVLKRFYLSYRRQK